MKNLLVAALAAAACTAWAGYPDKPITIVIPYAAGGPIDKTARELAQAMRAPLGNATLVIENVGGVDGTLGTTKVAKSAPDGYTLLLTHTGFATAPAMHRTLQYRPLEDFEYLGLIDEVPMILIAKPTLPAGNYAELTAWLRSNKDKPHLAVGAPGSASQLCGLALLSHIKVPLQTVSYKGTGPAMNDLIGGQVDLMCDQASNTAEQIGEGKVKAYAVTGHQRLSMPGLTRLPTLDEAGLKGFNVTMWHGLYAPKGTPAAVLATLNAALKHALKDGNFVKREEAAGATVVDDARVNAAEHKKFVEAEIKRWAPMIRATGQYAD